MALGHQQLAGLQGSSNEGTIKYEHDCTEICIKYAKKQLEARRKMRRRRRGKPLVETLYIADTDCRR